MPDAWSLPLSTFRSRTTSPLFPAGRQVYSCRFAIFFQSLFDTSPSATPICPRIKTVPSLLCPQTGNTATGFGAFSLAGRYTELRYKAETGADLCGDFGLARSGSCFGRSMLIHLVFGRPGLSRRGRSLLCNRHLSRRRRTDGILLRSGRRRLLPHLAHILRSRPPRCRQRGVSRSAAGRIPNFGKRRGAEPRANFHGKTLLPTSGPTTPGPQHRPDDVLCNLCKKKHIFL